MERVHLTENAQISPDIKTTDSWRVEGWDICKQMNTQFLKLMCLEPKKKVVTLTRTKLMIGSEHFQNSRACGVLLV